MQRKGKKGIISGGTLRWSGYYTKPTSNNEVSFSKNGNILVSKIKCKVHKCMLCGLRKNCCEYNQYIPTKSNKLYMNSNY